MPSARPVGVGSARLSICLMLYPHRAKHVESMRPTGPAPTMTWGAAAFVSDHDSSLHMGRDGSMRTDIIVWLRRMLSRLRFHLCGGWNGKSR